MPTELRIAGLERATAHLRGALNSVREALSEVSQDDEDVREAIAATRIRISVAHNEAMARIRALRDGREPKPVARMPVPESQVRYLARDSIDIIEGSMCAFNDVIGRWWDGDPDQFDREWVEAWWTLYSAVPEMRTEVLEALPDHDPESDEE